MANRRPVPKLPAGPRSASGNVRGLSETETVARSRATADYALYTSGKTCPALNFLSKEYNKVYKVFVQRPVPKNYFERETNVVLVGILSIEWERRMLNVSPRKLHRKRIKCDFHLRRSTADPHDVVFSCDSHQVNRTWNCDVHYQAVKAGY